MKRMISRAVKLLALVLALSLLLSTCAFALTPEEAGWKTGSFRYVLGDDSDLTDAFVYNDAWFDTDSSVENPQLRTISLIAAMASGSSNEKDYPEKSANLKALLSELGFEDIAVNTFYTQKPSPFTEGCCIARKQIGDATLLAITPRSQGYEAEWSSNFDVGSAGMHQGFKNARDEVLRFAQAYVQQHGITGRLKVWIAGHSRGAAVANLTAGFLADYPGWLGELALSDLYAYTFGTPAGISTAVTAAEVRDVAVVAAGDPSGATPGGGTAVGAETIDLSNAKYGCIRNYFAAGDLFARVVPAAWDFTRYGKSTVFTTEWADVASTAQSYLSKLDLRIQDSMLFGNPDQGFMEMMISQGDDGIGLVPVAGSTMTASQFIDGRVAMLLDAAGGTQASYVSGGCQGALTTLCAVLFGKELDTEALLNGFLADPEAAADAVLAALSVYIYCLYAKAETMPNAADCINTLRTQLSTLGLGAGMKPDLIREPLLGALGDGEFAVALTDALLAKMTAFFYDALLYSVAEGDSYANAMLNLSAGKLLVVLNPVLESGLPAEKRPVLTVSGAVAAVKVLANTLFGNNDPVYQLPVMIEIRNLFTGDIVTTINPCTAELNTAATLFSNIGALGREHISADILCWMRAKDSCYIPSTRAGEVWDFSAYINKEPDPEPAVDPEPEYELVVVKKAEFTDVHTGEFFADAVAWAVAQNITKGTTDTTFSPNADCTRGQVVTFLWRAAGSPEVTDAAAFSDVPADAYYASAVAWAVKNGITNGTSDTTFSPDAVCTRGQIVTFLWRAAGSPAAAGSKTFSDVPDEAYYAPAVAWAVETGITNGTSDVSFSPDAVCTRAQVVTFLWRMK